MVITLNVANESNSDYTNHGEDAFYLSQGKSRESCTKNFVKHLKDQWDYYEYEADETRSDISGFLHIEFSRWHKSEENWADIFPDFCFPRSNRAAVIEISREMHDLIIEKLA